MFVKLTVEFQQYIEKVLHLQVMLGDAIDGGVPFYLLDRYRLRRADILGHPCVLMMPRSVRRLAPVILKKDSQRIQEILERVPIWVSLQMEAYDRRKLIEYRVPFVVPGFQAYLPDLLIDLRERFQRLWVAKPSLLSPATQRFLLEAFYRRAREVDWVGTFSSAQKYSSMTRSRVLSELEAAGLAETRQSGVKRHAFITAPWDELLKQALPLLKSPVKRRVHLGDGSAAQLENLPRAGLTALAEFSELSSPRIPVYATVARFPEAQHNWWARVETVKDEAEVDLELWSYSPLLDTERPDCVDRLSLYLSLREENDPRTQDALDRMLKEIT